MAKVELEFSSFALTLKKYLMDNDDERQDDHEWINARSDAAAGEYEAARLQGCTVDEAFERANEVLMRDLD